MALHWNLTEVQNHEELVDENNWATTESIIFYTMLVGMPNISEANHEEFFTRVHFYEKLFGSIVYMIDDNNERINYPITLSEVKRRIGLRTNADTMTKSKFMNHFFKQFTNESLRAANK